MKQNIVLQIQNEFSILTKTTIVWNFEFLIKIAIFAKIFDF